MSKHVVIIGGGIIGLCAAHYATQSGLRVTVIDRNSGGHEGCSFGNAGMIVPSHFVPLAAPGMVALGLRWMGNPESPFYVQPRWSWDLLKWGFHFWRACTLRHVEAAAPLLRDLHLASRALFEKLADAWSNDFGLTPNGLLMLCKTERSLAKEAHGAEQAKRLGIPAEVLDAAATAALDPAARMDVCGSVHYPRDAHLTPQRFMAAMQSRLAGGGCRFHWKCEVTGFERRGRAIALVQTTRGNFEADEVVVAGGVWSAGLARSLGLNLPLQAGKGYSLTLPRPRQLPRLCSILTEARVAVTPMCSTLRFGGTLELTDLNSPIRAARVRGIINAALRYFPDFRREDFSGVVPWQGLRPCSPDGLPYLGRIAGYDNLVIATGHAMMGVSLGPVTGQLVARLLNNEPTEVDIERLRPDRFAS